MSERRRTLDNGVPIGIGTGLQVEMPTALLRIAARHRGKKPGQPDEIGEDLLAAGERLYEEYHSSAMEPRVCSIYEVRSSATATADSMPDSVAQAHAQLRAALRAISLPHHREVVRNVVLLDQEDSRVQALKIGLTQLARHWGILRKVVGDR